MTEAPKGIRIVSDGTMMGTEIFNEDGTRIPYVQKVTWELDVKSLLSTATLTIQKVRADVKASEVREEERTISFPQNNTTEIEDHTTLPVEGP